MQKRYRYVELWPEKMLGIPQTAASLVRVRGLECREKDQVRKRSKKRSGDVVGTVRYHRQEETGRRRNGEESVWVMNEIML